MIRKKGSTTPSVCKPLPRTCVSCEAVAEAQHLSQVTTEEDLEIIFSRFGTITSCDIIRDHKTGVRLQL
jgi:RNA recognition motif-containing protein